MRSILNAEGPIKTASQRTDSLKADDRKVDLIIRELDTCRYKIKVAALQETKWFSSGIYKVGESMLVTAGRPVPAPGEMIQREKGVAVVLSGPAIEAWRESGKRCKVWSPRLISACVFEDGKKES